MSIRASTSAASASCGITSGRTKLVTSSRRSPVRASASISSTLRSVAIVSGSFWNPSRGPTSGSGTAQQEDSLIAHCYDIDRPPLTFSVWPVT